MLTNSLGAASTQRQVLLPQPDVGGTGAKRSSKFKLPRKRLEPTPGAGPRLCSPPAPRPPMSQPTVCVFFSRLGQQGVSVNPPLRAAGVEPKRQGPRSPQILPTLAATKRDSGMVASRGQGPQLTGLGARDQSRAWQLRVFWAHPGSSKGSEAQLKPKQRPSRKPWATQSCVASRLLRHLSAQKSSQ